MLPAERSLIDRATPAIPELYVVLALISTVLMVLFLPPFLVSDEGTHSQRAYSIAHGNWLAYRGPAGIGAPVDTSLADVAAVFRAYQERSAGHYTVASARPDGRLPLSVLPYEQKVFWSHRREFHAFPNTAVYPPMLYLPQILGWRLAEGLNFSILHSLLCVRLLDAFCSIAIGWWALRIARLNRWLLAAYLLLPTVMGLVASCSQDALLVTVVALVAAILSRVIAERRTLLLWEWILVTVLFACIVMARPPYLPLMLTLFLPQRTADRHRGIRRYLAPALAVLLASAALLAWQKMVPATASYEGYIAGVDPKLQLLFLRSHPLRGIVNVLGGTLSLAPHLAVKALYSLGWNDIYPPIALYAVLVLSLAGLCLSAQWRGLSGWRSRSLLLFGVIASILAISFAEYLIWTPVGAHALEGPLARYYPPFIPFLLLLSSDKLRGWKTGSKLEWLPLASAALFVAILLTPPWLLSHRFYNLGPAAVLRATLR